MCSWMGGQKRDLISGTFKAVPECTEDLSLSILARSPHKELKTCEAGREGRRTSGSPEQRGRQLGV